MQPPEWQAIARRHAIEIEVRGTEFRIVGSQAANDLP
jgi:hypothetical protein